MDAKLNAVIHKTFDRALEQAKKADLNRGKDASPLAGIPYLTKDVFCEEGVPSTVASNVLRGVRGGKDYAPPFDSTTIRSLSFQIFVFGWKSGPRAARAKEQEISFWLLAGITCRSPVRS